MGRRLFQFQGSAAAAEDRVEHSAARMDVPTDDDVVEHRQVAKQPARLERAGDAALDDRVRGDPVDALTFQADLAG